MKQVFIAVLCWTSICLSPMFSMRVVAQQSNTAMAKEFAKILDPLTDKKQLPGYYFAVFKDGKKAFERAEGLADDGAGVVAGETTLYALGSMTRPLTALAVLRLIETTDLRLDHPVSKYIPDFGNLLVAFENAETEETVTAAREITILDLLTHTSGLSDSNMLSSIDGISATYKQQGILTNRSRADSRWGGLKNHVSKLAHFPLASQPGVQFIPSLGYDVAARVIEVVSGKSFETYLTEVVLLPLGMIDTHFRVPLEKQSRLARLYSPLKRTYQIPGIPKMYQHARVLPKGVKNFGIKTELIGGGTGLVSTGRDYALFLNFLLKRATENPLSLTEESFDLMLTDQLGQLLEQDSMVPALGKASKNQLFSVGLGIVLTEDAATPNSYDFLTWDSGFNVQFWIDPATQVSGIFMTQIFPSRFQLTADLEDIADRFLAD